MSIFSGVKFLKPVIAAPNSEGAVHPRLSSTHLLNALFKAVLAGSLTSQKRHLDDVTRGLYNIGSGFQLH